MVCSTCQHEGASNDKAELDDEHAAALHADIQQHSNGRHFHWSTSDEEAYFSPCNDSQGIHGNEGSNVVDIELVFIGKDKE